MKLLEDIINELVDSNLSLTYPFLKTKVLASRINNISLLKWVDDELNGYPNELKIPSYRITSACVYGSFLSGNVKMSNFLIPTLRLNDEYMNIFNKNYFKESIQSLEIMKNTPCNYGVPSELYGILIEELESNGYRFVHLYHAEKKIPLTSISEVLSIIRNKLLEIMLAIEKQFGKEVNIENLKSKNRQITSMVTNYISNSGYGIVTNIGDNNNIKANIKIKIKDKIHLEKTLKDISISDDEIKNLLSIIDEEEPNLKERTFGTKVSAWIKKMSDKSKSGIRTISLGAAGNLLSNAIWLYYTGS